MFPIFVHIATERINPEFVINQFTEDEKFTSLDFTVKPLVKGEYERCLFINCNFAGIDLSEFVFSECRFTDCDLSNAKLRNTSFRDVVFKNCKQLGLRFDECSKMLLSFSFDTCALDFSSFFKLKIKGTVFKGCRLHNVEFAEADLTKAIFAESDLNRASFENTIVEGGDFRTAYNYSFDPEKNKIKKARFSATGAVGLLDKYGIVIEL